MWRTAGINMHVKQATATNDNDDSDDDDGDDRGGGRNRYQRTEGIVVAGFLCDIPRC